MCLPSLLVLFQCRIGEHLVYDRRARRRSWVSARAGQEVREKVVEMKPRRVTVVVKDASESATLSVVDSLIALAEAITECRRCERLVEWREKIAEEKRAAYAEDEYWGRGVPGFGDPEAKVVIVGLAPAAHGANRTGRVFTGDRSGDFLFASLHRTGFANQPLARHVDDGLALHDAYVTAAVRCAPPANKPTPEERDNCRPYIEKELALLTESKVFVALGQFGYQVASSILGIRPRPKFGHGLVVPIEQQSDAIGRHVVCSFHPSQQNTFTGRLTEPMLDQVFITARELAGMDPI